MKLLPKATRGVWLTLVVLFALVVAACAPPAAEDEAPPGDVPSVRTLLEVRPYLEGGRVFCNHPSCRLTRNIKRGL
jgi:hypothetical protein